VQTLALVKVAQASAPSKQAVVTECNDFRPAVEKYFGQYTEQALFVATKESGCQNIKSHKANSNGTWDYCYMQINNEPSALDVDTCARRAWEKFKASNFTWRQWYAVCAVGGIAKYSHIKCTNN